MTADELDSRLERLEEAMISAEQFIQNHTRMVEYSNWAKKEVEKAKSDLQRLRIEYENLCYQYFTLKTA